MGFKRHWTHEQDDHIRQSRTARRNWDQIALDLAASRTSVMERARFLGVARAPRPPATRPEVPVLREAYPAGHSVAWETITAGTSLAATPYPYPPIG